MPANAASAILPPTDLIGAMCSATGLLRRVPPVELAKTMNVPFARWLMPISPGEP
jgi:hypothetical protein